MKRFNQLIQVKPGLSAREQQEAADRGLAKVAHEIGFRMFEPGDSIPQRGRRLLIGVATYSDLDMELLDELSDRVTASKHIFVDIFNVRTVRKMDDFGAYIGGIGPVYQTPVVGFWTNGNLVERATGKQGRDLARRVVETAMNESVNLCESVGGDAREEAAAPPQETSSPTVLQSKATADRET